MCLSIHPPIHSHHMHVHSVKIRQSVIPECANRDEPRNCQGVIYHQKASWTARRKSIVCIQVHELKCRNFSRRQSIVCSQVGVLKMLKIFFFVLMSNLKQSNTKQACVLKLWKCCGQLSVYHLYLYACKSNHQLTKSIFDI